MTAEQVDRDGEQLTRGQAVAADLEEVDEVLEETGGDEKAAEAAFESHDRERTSQHGQPDV